MNKYGTDILPNTMEQLISLRRMVPLEWYYNYTSDEKYLEMA